MPTGGSGLIGSLTARMPLLRGYDVVVATIAPATGVVTLGTRPLFKPGDVQGAESVLTLRRAPGDRDATTLAVAVARDAPSADGTVIDGPGLGVVSLHEVPLPDEPVYHVRAVLDAPGRVRFTEPRGVTPLSRPWPEVIATIPRRVDWSPARSTWSARLSSPGRRNWSTSGVTSSGNYLRTWPANIPIRTGCGWDCSAVRTISSRPVRSGGGWCAASRSAPRPTRCWPWPTSEATASAIWTRRRWRTCSTRRTACWRTARPRVARRGCCWSQADGHTARILGPDMVQPCPFRCDWRGLTRRLAESAVSVVAVVDTMPGRAARDKFWADVGRSGLHALSATSVREVGADLGVSARKGQRIGVPLPA